MQTNVLASQLIHHLRSHQLVKQEEQLKSPEWTKSCYELLSTIIGQKLMEVLSSEELYTMGTSISYKTLKTIFDGKYQLKFPLDPRALNTLNKLSRFLDFEDWNDFAQKVRAHEQAQLAEQSPEEIVTSTMSQAIEESFKAIHQMSLNGSVQLRSYFLDNSPAFNRIAELIHYNKERGYNICNKYNPSNCELLDLEIESINGETARVKTKEFWLLCWWDQHGERYRKRLKKVCSNQYILQKSTDNHWMITKTITEDDLFTTLEEHGAH